MGKVIASQLQFDPLSDGYCPLVELLGMVALGFLPWGERGREREMEMEKGREGKRERERRRGREREREGEGDGER